MTEEQFGPSEIPEEDLAEIYTLTDEESGEELEFALLAEADIDGVHYMALEPIDQQDEESENGEYVILIREEDEFGEVSFSSIDDDETFDKVAEFFDDLFMGDVDYDA